MARSFSRGFSLIEVLVTIVIIGAVTALKKKHRSSRPPARSTLQTHFRVIRNAIPPRLFRADAHEIWTPAGDSLSTKSQGTARGYRTSSGGDRGWHFSLVMRPKFSLPFLS